MSPRETDDASPGLAAHERRAARDLGLAGRPPRHWPAAKPGPDGQALIDVVVVGAGMCGIAAAAGLILIGIRNVRVLDQNAAGREGPWLTFARMETLRSPKHLPGPAMGIPSLTFRAWHEACHGVDGWERLYKIPRDVWMDYLGWLQPVLALPIESDATVTRLAPTDASIAVTVESGAGTRVLHPPPVVLPPGRGGAGGLPTPDLLDPTLVPALAAPPHDPSAL